MPEADKKGLVAKIAIASAVLIAVIAIAYLIFG